MISREEIENLAALSRLKLMPGEAEALEKDFSAILDYVGQLQSYDAQKGDEVAAVRNVMRDDTTGPGVGGTPQTLIEAAPKSENGYVVVRKIIQRDE